MLYLVRFPENSSLWIHTSQMKPYDWGYEDEGHLGIYGRPNLL